MSNTTTLSKLQSETERIVGEFEIAELEMQRTEAKRAVSLIDQQIKLLKDPSIVSSFRESRMQSWFRRSRKLPKQPYPIKVFFAGKVEKNGFRHEIVPNLRDCLQAGNVEAEGDAPGLNHWIDFEREGVRFCYTGPFPIGCDHGCYHGDTTHGYGLRVGGCSHIKKPPVSRRKLYNKCLSSIRHSDILFVWIECLTCFGTLVEIGKASIPIVIGIKEGLDTSELWFALEAASQIIVAPTAEEAFCEAVPKMVELKKERHILRSLFKPNDYLSKFTNHKREQLDKLLLIAEQEEVGVLRRKNAGPSRDAVKLPKRRGRKKMNIAEILE